MEIKENFVEKLTKTLDDVECYRKSLILPLLRRNHSAVMYCERVYKVVSFSIIKTQNTIRWVSERVVDTIK